MSLNWNLWKYYSLNYRLYYVDCLYLFACHSAYLIGPTAN